MNLRTLSTIEALGAYPEDIATNLVPGKLVSAHINEYTTQKSNKVNGPKKGIVPVQIVFCIEEKNQKKINSNRRFLNAYFLILLPSVCVPLDVSTRLGPSALYHLWRASGINSKVGGACGDIIT